MSGGRIFVGSDERFLQPSECQHADCKCADGFPSSYQGDHREQQFCHFYAGLRGQRFALPRERINFGLMDTHKWRQASPCGAVLGHGWRNPQARPRRERADASRQPKFSRAQRNVWQSRPSQRHGNRKVSGAHHADLCRQCSEVSVELEPGEHKTLHGRGPPPRGGTSMGQRGWIHENRRLCHGWTPHYHNCVASVSTSGLFADTGSDRSAGSQRRQSGPGLCGQRSAI